MGDHRRHPDDQALLDAAFAYSEATTLARGQVAAVAAGGGWTAASMSGRPAVGVCIGATSAGRARVQTAGVVRMPAASLTVGATYWLGADGALLSSCPTGAGQLVQKVGVALDARRLCLALSNPILL